MGRGGFRRARRTGETQIGDAVRGLVGKLDKGGNLSRARAVGAWRDAAGDEVASHARGFAMREDELLVFVDSAIWANELSALSEHYRTAVNALLGSELVGSVRFTVSRHVAEENAWDAQQSRRLESEPPDLIEPVPATTEEAAQIQAMAASIHDAQLREVAVGTALRALEWRKGRRSRKSPQAATGRPEDPESRPEH